MDRTLARRIRERDARLLRMAKRHPGAAKNSVNALAKVRYYRDDPDEHICTCGTVAEEWVLFDVSEVEGPWFFAYSDDIHAYVPHCTPCALDVGARIQHRIKAYFGWS